MARWKKGKLTGPTKEPLPVQEEIKADVTIGSRFVVDGLMYEVVADEYCARCGFRGKICPPFLCDPELRFDDTQVSFELVRPLEETGQ